MVRFTTPSFPQSSVSTAIVVMTAVIFSTATAAAQGIKHTVDSLSAVLKLARADHNDTLIALLLGEIGKALWGTYPDSAMVFEQEMLRFSKSIGYARGEGIAYNNIGYIFRKKSQYDECLEYSHKALNILEQIGDKSTAAWCYHNIGNVHFSRGRFDLALENHFKALRLRESIGERKAMAWSLSNISDIYREQGYKQQAIDYTNKAIILFNETGDKHGAAVAFNSIGVILQEQRKYDEAFENYLKALALDEASEHGIGQIWSLRFLGEVSMLQQRYDRARTYFQRGLALCRKLNDRKQEIWALLNLGKVFQATDNVQKSIECAKAALLLADSLHSQNSLQEVYAFLADVYAASGNFEAAYQYHKRSSGLRDSLFSAASSKKIAELTTQYDADKRKKEIEILTKDNALQEAALKRDALTRNSLIAGVFVLLVIAVLLVQRYRLAERARAALRTKNEEITRQQRILEDQAAEIEISNSRLHEQNLMLQQLNVEKNEFLGIAAHDLKNPLTSITMNASGLRDHYDRFPPDVAKERLTGIVTASQRMASIITNLLDINAIETGNLNIQCRPTDIFPIIRHSIEDYSERAAEKEIQIHWSNDSAQSMLLNVDTGIFAEIFDNLISNAVKYSPREKNVFVRVLEVDGCARIEVRDEGPGLNEEDKKRLFGKFARLSAQPTAGEHSTGLGLSIVKRLAEAMQGRVGCSSTLGNGATFFVEFPLLKS